MKVFVSADIEGVTGVVAWEGQCSSPGNSPDWAFARRMMTHDVNYAIIGAREGGATHVTVKDSHGRSKNLLVDELEPGVDLISGFGSHPDGMMTGIDRSYDCALLIGYHAMAGTEAGVLEHTISGFVHTLKINGQPSGELALSMMVAGAYGVPVVLVTSDEAGANEAEKLVPFVETVSVKQGYGRHMARLRHPSETSKAIENAAREAVRRCKTVEPYVTATPIEIELTFVTSSQADLAAKLPDIKRRGAYTVFGEYPTALAAHVGCRAMIAHASMGRDADR